MESGGAMVLGKLLVPGRPMVLGKLPVPGRPTMWITVGQGPIVLAVGAGGGCLDIFSLIYHFSFLSLSLWETARYRLIWLVGCFGFNGPLRQYFSLYRTVSQREGERGKKGSLALEILNVCTLMDYTCT